MCVVASGGTTPRDPSANDWMNQRCGYTSSNERPAASDRREPRTGLLRTAASFTHIGTVAKGCGSLLHLHFGI